MKETLRVFPASLWVYAVSVSLQFQLADAFNLLPRECPWKVVNFIERGDGFLLNIENANNFPWFFVFQFLETCFTRFQIKNNGRGPHDSSLSRSNWDKLLTMNREFSAVISRAWAWPASAMSDILDVLWSKAGCKDDSMKDHYTTTSEFLQMQGCETVRL